MFLAKSPLFIFSLFIFGVLESTAESLDIKSFKIIDLTYPFNEKTIYWPTSPSTFQFEELAYGRTEGGYFYAAYAICTPEHGGTHLDAPIHFGEGKHSID